MTDKKKDNNPDFENGLKPEEQNELEKLRQHNDEVKDKLARAIKPTAGYFEPDCQLPSQDL